MSDKQLNILILGYCGDDAVNLDGYHSYVNLKNRGHNVQWIEKREAEKIGNINLNAFDKIICLDHTYTPSLDAQLSKVNTVYNVPKYVYITTDKWNNYLFLLNKYPQPISYNDHPHNLSYPIVVKNRFGSLGKDVAVARNYDEYKTKKDFLIKKELILTDFRANIEDVLIYQQCITSSWGQDLRVVLIGGKYVACELRKNTTGAIQSNLAQGGEAYTYEMTPEQIVLCEAIARELKLDYVGIDMLFGENGELIFCEANSCAFFDGITAITGIDICDKLMDYILNNDPMVVNK